ncbi:MAG TPA: hypothetical protein VGJ33_09270 [Candidatus Angelobacter sp.]|jgi:hypothetical protein
MSIKNGAITGAIVGTGVAVVLLSLEYIRPFPGNANAFVEKLTFKLCPAYILIFMNVVSKEWMVVALTILGNAVLYGLVFGAIAGILSLFKRSLV